MTSFSIIFPFDHFRQPWRVFARPTVTKKPPNLHQLVQHSEQLPPFVRESVAARRYLELLGPLAWDQFPERNLCLTKGLPPVPYAPFVAACLVKLDQQFAYMSQLRQYLLDQPALIWLLGFPLVPSASLPWGFDPAASLPTQRHLTRMLRVIPNPVLQFLLDSSVSLLQAELKAVGVTLGQAISIDTKHILACVEENNPKAYVKLADRLDKTRQPKGDPDCKLGCKRKRNQPPAEEQATPPPKKARRTTNFSPNDEYFWGYASGVVATKVPDWGEFALAELTLTFDQPDVAYFYPLMAHVQRRLGFRPHYAAFDAAFDAFYIYEYFHSDQHDGFAAVPLTERGGKRQFDEHGWPLCQAGLPMPLKYTFRSKVTLFEHERGRYVCSLRFPQKTNQTCPVNHKQWPKGGCISTLPTSIGARIRHQLNRHSDIYKQVYKQRTASERINSQAEALGIERPKIRNFQAIANQNTLIYILINLRGLQRIRRKKADRQI